MSVLSGIHHRDGGGMPGINLSHAFSVLLTFSSSSPKRRVVCQRAFIKADRRGKQCEGSGGVQRGKKKRRRQRLSAGTCRQVITGKVPLAAESSPAPPSAGDEEMRGVRSGHRRADVLHDSRGAARSQTLKCKHFVTVLKSGFSGVRWSSSFF